MPDLAFCVEPGWVLGVITGDFRVLFYEDGHARFEHRCDRGERGTIICAPLLQLDNGHRVLSMKPLHIEPSILCSDCGTHGFVCGGRWFDA